MTERRSCWTRRLVLALVLAGAGTGVPGAARAQDDLAAACTAALAPAECRLAAGAVRTVQPRVGLALWGGAPVPGTASTLGLRLRASPRWSVAGKIGLVPVERPPLLDRTETDGSLGLITAVSVQTTVGVVHGFAPLPTVGGFLSVDLLGRVSHARVPDSGRLGGAGVWAFAVGGRLGLLRESFTLPGLSVTAMYGRSTTLDFGDVEGLDAGGAFRGRVRGWRGSVDVSRRLLGLRLTGGLAWDRYTTPATVRYGGFIGGTARGDAIMERWGGHGSVTWTRLIYHVVVEAGWQEAPTPAGLPAGVTVGPVGWWTAVSFRVSP